MLRITIEDSPEIEDHPEAVIFRVEGRLVGAWARELEQCWKSAVSVSRNRASIIDLTSILFIDQEGKRVLTKLFGEGASFRTASPMTESIVSEIILASKPNPQVQVANPNVAVTLYAK